MPTNYLLMEDDGTVTLLTMCDTCRYLFRDIDKHVEESVTVLGNKITTSAPLTTWLEEDDD
jgi:hypothetical protein